jgi:hypothetical protein
MKTKLSHSQISKYQLCGKSYEYHYIHKIRPRVTSAALVFGSALDAALNVVLTEDEGNKAEVLFERSFRFHHINNEQTYIPTCVDVVYANTDFDSDLLTEDDYNHIEEQTKEWELDGHTDPLETYKALSNKKKQSGFDSLSFDEKRFFNLLNWLSSRRKGLLMLNAYRKKVIPRLEKVHAVQEYVSLDNEVGDKIVGYVDLIADVKGVGTVILDNKTSAREYEEDSVLTSPQLSLYTHILKDKYNTRLAGYIVMRKSVIKNRKKICSKCEYDGSGARHKTCNNVVEGVRCNGEWTETIDPDIHIQFITDSIPEKTEEIVLENTDVINESIKQGLFPRNLNSCTNYFGGNCPYLGLCYKGDMHGLLDVNKKK